MFKLFCRVFQIIMRYAAYFLPWRKPKLLEGAGSLARLPGLIVSGGIESVLLVTDRSIASLGLIDSLLEGLKAADVRCAVYDKTVPNPTIDNIEEAYALYRENACKGIIAFGGGSPMDCAKGVGARAARPRKPIQKMKGLLKVLLRLPPIYAVPTTAGTGSEVTVASVVVNSRTHEKYALMDPALIPRYAVLDPLLTLGLPPHITATTGVDALTHAVEAYIGRSNTKETREMARETVRLVFEFLYRAYTDGNDLTARANMQRAAYCGGVAFTRAYVGNIHAVAHTLGGVYSVPHGLANAVIMPHVLDYYGESVVKPLSELAEVAGLAGGTDEIKARAFIRAIRELNASMGIPETIAGIEEKDIELMAERAFHEANPTYPVPRIFSREDFKAIYHALMGRGLPGYAGKMARIDLTAGSVEEFRLTREETQKTIGGKTLAAKIIYDAFTEKVDAYAPENLIVITTSPLNGTRAPSSSRFNVSTISPLTGLLVSSNCGGSFGLHLKRAGYDGLVVSGISPSNVYIHVGESGVEIRDASALWGKNTGETQALLGEGALTIGIAGENLVRYAALISGERAAGRGGVGAVFGAKRLKAIVAEGERRVGIYNQPAFDRLCRKWVKKLRAHALTGEQLPKLGTAGLVSMMHYRGLLATKNYAQGSFDAFERISGETLREKHLVKNKGCKTCPIQCGRVVRLSGREVKGPELETLGLLGANLLNGDLELIIKLNHLCDEYGLDTMSFGGSLGFAMELNEKGLWDNGLRFGACEGLEELVGQVARREGIGDDLAEGTKRLAQKYGGDEYAIHSKGLELAAYEPRAAQGMGLGYATANRGGCHLGGGYLVVLEGLGLQVSGKTTRGKAAFNVFFQDLMEAASAGGSCLFTTYAVLPSFMVKYPQNIFVRMICALMPSFGGLVTFLHNHTRLLEINLPGVLPHSYAIKLATGTPMTFGAFVRAGERGYNLERLVNLRQGLQEGDTLPKRLTGELQREGDETTRVRLEKMLPKYYRIRGWDERGAPTLNRLKRLGLV